MIRFDKIAEYLSNPLVLIGFGLLIFYYFFKNVIKGQLLKKLSKDVSEKIVIRIINSMIIIVLLLIVLGFTLQLLNKSDNLRTVNPLNDIPDSEKEVSLEEDNNRYIELRPIIDLDEKINSFKFNVNKGDLINLTYNSKGWKFDVNFIISSDYLIKDLKSAIIHHFELEKYVKFHYYGGRLEINWYFIANHRIIENENLSLIDAGLNNNDIVSIRIVAQYYDITEAVEELSEKAIDE